MNTYEIKNGQLIINPEAEKFVTLRQWTRGNFYVARYILGVAEREVAGVVKLFVDGSKAGYRNVSRDGKEYGGGYEEGGRVYRFAKQAGGLLGGETVYEISYTVQGDERTKDDVRRNHQFVYTQAAALLARAEAQGIGVRVLFSKKDANYVNEMLARVEQALEDPQKALEESRKHIGSALLNRAEYKAGKALEEGEVTEVKGVVALHKGGTMPATDLVGKKVSVYFRGRYLMKHNQVTPAQAAALTAHGYSVKVLG